MGLKNFTQQMAAINKSNTGIQYLKDYAKSMNTMMDNINISWIGGSDKIALLNFMTQCVQNATRLANDYTIFMVNAKRWLNEMNELDKISKSMVSSSNFSVSVKKIPRLGSAKLHIKIDELEGLVTIINGYGKKLELVCSGMDFSRHSLDKLILQRFPDKYSLGNLSRRINELKADNTVIATDIKQICDKYRKVENEIQDIANELMITGNSSGAVDAQTKRSSSVKKAVDKRKSDIEKKIQNILESTGIEDDVADKIMDIILPTEIEHWLELGADWADERYGEIWSDISDIVMDIDYNGAYGELNLAILAVKGVVSKINVAAKSIESGYKIVTSNIKKEGIITGIIKSIIPVGQQYTKTAVDASVGLIKNTIESLPFVGDSVEMAEKALMAVTGENISTGLDDIAANIESYYDYGCKQAQKGINKILKIDNVSSGISQVERWIKSKLAG